MQSKGSLEIALSLYNNAEAELERFSGFVRKNAAVLESEGLADRLRTLAKKYREMLSLAPAPGELIGLSPLELIDRMKTDTTPLVKEIEQTIQKMLGAE